MQFTIALAHSLPLTRSSMKATTKSFILKKNLSDDKGRLTKNQIPFDFHQFLICWFFFFHKNIAFVEMASCSFCIILFNIFPFFIASRFCAEKSNTLTENSNKRKESIETRQTNKQTNRTTITTHTRDTDEKRQISHRFLFILYSQSI